MRRVEGSGNVALIERVNPIRDKWRVRWDVRVAEDGMASYMEEEFGHRPTVAEVRALVSGWINGNTNAAILSGFSYEGSVVWLSTENQFNYKAAYDLAVQTGGASLPVTIKIGEEDDPVYKTFDTLDALTAFYTAAMAHVRKTLEEGWKAKDGFDVTPYRLE
ncbi:MAG: hypothetical protein LBN29_01390 [Mediterranea sp.]|jgi:hypothetical protein|nr:hypothetical protein [Mediterranea sp.]